MDHNRSGDAAVWANSSGARAGSMDVTSEPRGQQPSHPWRQAKPRGASTTDDDHLVNRAFGWAPVTSDVVESVDLLKQRELASNTSAKRWDTVYRVVITIGAMLAGLLAATTQAFNTISGDLEQDTHTSDVFVSLLTGFGLAGLQFTIFAGILLDVLGPWKTCLIGDAFVVLGYIGMSYTSSPVLLVVLLTLVGLGSGAAFLSGFKTVIELGNPLGVGLTSCAMSASIFLTIAMKGALLNVTGCEGNACWRQVVRLDGTVCGIVFLVAAVAFVLRSKVESLNEPEAKRRTSSVYSLGSGAYRSLDKAEGSKIDCKQACAGCYGGLFVFRDPFFWRLAIADVAGLGCGIFIIASARQLWLAFDPSSNDSPTLLKVFSILAGFGNVLYPVLSDFLSRQQYITRVRLMAATLALYACVFLAIALINNSVGNSPAHTPPSETLRWTMFVLMCSVGFGFGAALVGFPVCVSSSFPVEYFGTILSYTQMLASTFSVLAPTLTAASFQAAGSYTPIYLAMTGVLVLGAVLLAVPHTPVAGTPSSELDANMEQREALIGSRANRQVVGYNSSSGSLNERAHSKDVVHGSVL